MQWHLVKFIALAATVLALPTVGRERQDDCEEVAKAIKTASEAEAHADYWIEIANCRNGPDQGDASCEKEAKAGLTEALALANEQYVARKEVCARLGGGGYDPQLSPSEFSADVTNQYMPLEPGHTLVYEGDSEGGFVHNEVTTTNATVQIDGFTVRVVEDTVEVDGVLAEHATDYFAQRANGDVWYFGEVSREYVDGFLDSLEGSWRTGKEHAKPGIAMLASPHVDDFYRQEYLVNVAEDVAQVIATDETVTVAYGTFAHCLQTEETAALEPDALEWKFYAPGVGLVLILDLETGERLELVDIK